MNVFSWFRQKRRGIRPASQDEIRIPLTATPTFGLVVYCRLGAGIEPPDHDALRRCAADWTLEHAAEPLRSAIRNFTDQGLLNLYVHDRAEMPEPPDEILRAYNPGETEERRFRNATHAIVIGSPDLLTPPRIGLWSVIAAARGIASTLRGGVVVDPEFPRILSLESLSEPLPFDGYVRVPEHILIPYSADPRSGLLWITTKGMTRFGLPEVEIRDAPPNLAGSLMPILNGVAQRLVHAAMRHVAETDDDEDPPDMLPLRAQFRFGIEDIRAAYTETDAEDMENLAGRAEAANRAESAGAPEPAVVSDAPQASTYVRLEMSESRGGEGAPRCVRLIPPRSSGAGTPHRSVETGVWLNRLLTDIMGSDPQIEAVEVGDASMEEAHRIALAELPYVRARFREGFRSGEVLHVKHGFATEEQGSEFMWIAVTIWEEGRIHGLIANDPQYRRDLRAGQVVEIDESDVYDWMIAHRDGRVEGAYTARALEALSDNDAKPEDRESTDSSFADRENEYDLRALENFGDFRDSDNGDFDREGE